jgi:uncharacterized membrane protein
VEVVEAFTIVLAVAVLHGLRPALAGAGAALAVLAALVAVLGPLLSLVPIRALQFGIGLLLLLMGLGWLRKAALRLAGSVPLRDEAAAFARAGDRLRREQAADWLAGIAAFKAVLLEGLEVVFIVVAIGAGRGMLVPAAMGARAACLMVLAVGAALHRPLTRVPENALKFGVGVMLCAFGLFWTGEGLGLAWPGGEAALPGFVALFLAAGLGAAQLARRPA